MIVRGALAAALAAGLAAGAPGHGLAAPARSAPRAAPRADTEAATRDWLAQIGLWGQKMTPVALAEYELFDVILEGQQTAVRFFTAHDAKGGEAWAADWEKARREQIATYRAAIEEAAATPLPEPPPNIDASPQFAEMVRTLRSLPASGRQRREANLLLMDRLIIDAVRVAKGDREAARGMSRRLMETSIAMLESEEATLQTALSVSPPGTPGRDLLDAGKESDDATMAMLQGRLADLDHSEADRMAAVGRMREHIAAMREASKRARTDADTQIRRYAPRPGAPASVLDQRLVAALATIGDSAALEDTIAQTLETLADHLAKGDMDDSPEAKAAIDSINGLVARRVELDARRKRIIAGQQ